MNDIFKILIVEDNLGDVRLAKELLADTKLIQFDLITVDTLSAAIDILQQQHVNLILLDLGLPDSQGFETFNEINQLNLNIPIIILSGLSDEEIALSAVRAGAQDYFVKGSLNGQLLSHAILYAIERKKANDTVKEYAAIIENADEAIYSKNLDGTIKTWNNAAEKLYGYTADEMIDQSDSKLYPPGFNTEMANILQTIQAGGHIIQLHTKHIRKDGKILTVSMTASPIKIYRDELSGISILARDISMQKSSEQQLAIQYRIATILNKANDIPSAMRIIMQTICEVFKWHIGEVWLVDPLTNTLRIANTWVDNDMYLEIEQSNNDVIFHLNEGLPGYIWKFANPYWIPDTSKDVLRTQINPLLLKHNLKSALGFPIIFNQTVLGVAIFYNAIQKPDANLLGMLISIGEQLGIFVNRIQVENEKTIRQEQLHIKNKELEDQTEFLRQANRAKTTFLANMSHELRTPLHSVIGFTELMYKEKVGTIKSKHKEYLGEIAVSAHHLLHLINDILDLTKIESGKIDLHPEVCNLVKLINEVKNSMSLFIADKKICFSMSIDQALTGDIIIDPDKFKKILFNYISNAVKFTPASGKISVAIKPEDKNTFRLEVIDTGIGISKHDVEKLFVMFGQLNISYSKPYQGIGLGLALTRHIAEVLGGHVGVISKVGKGSTFFAVLPLVQPGDQISK